MRKPKRLPYEQLAPYIWEMPLAVRRGQLPPEEGQLPPEEGELPPEEGEPAAGTPRTLPAGDAPIDWQALFGNARPVEIEVGIGKGQFLVESALRRPEVNFFGIEVVRKYQLYATTRCAIRRLANVRTACADARWIFRYFIPPGSVQAVHIYFPDPWWKARHKKRRLFTEGFVRDVARALVPGGRLYCATDVQEYFGEMLRVLAATPELEIVRQGTDVPPLLDLPTNFERKARQRGSPIWRAECVRRADPAAAANAGGGDASTTSANSGIGVRLARDYPPG